MIIIATIIHFHAIVFAQGGRIKVTEMQTIIIIDFKIMLQMDY